MENEHLDIRKFVDGRLAVFNLFSSKWARIQRPMSKSWTSKMKGILIESKKLKSVRFSEQAKKLNAIRKTFPTSALFSETSSIQKKKVV
jgi:hypothetical protein